MPNFLVMVLALVVALAVIEGLKMAFGCQIAFFHMKQGLRMMQSPRALNLQAKIASQMLAGLGTDVNSGDYDLNTL